MTPSRSFFMDFAGWSLAAGIVFLTPLALVGLICVGATRLRAGAFAALSFLLGAVAAVWVAAVTVILVLIGYIELGHRGIDGYDKPSNPTGAFLTFFVASVNLGGVSLVAGYAIWFSRRKRRSGATAQ